MDEPILTLDETATAKLQSLKDAGRFDGSALRVTVSEDGAAFHYQLEVVVHWYVAVREGELID